MIRNRIIAATLITLGIAATLQATGAPGGARLLQGALRRLWEDRRLPAAPDQAQAVDLFLKENHRLLGLGTNHQVEIRRARVTPCALGQRYIYEQYAYGLPVFNSNLVLVAKDNLVKSLFNALALYDFQAASARISGPTARQAARSDLRLPGNIVKEELDLGYTTDGVLIYRARLFTLEPSAGWELWVNAGSGRILRRIDLRQFVEGSGQAFDPDPKTALQCDTLHDWGDNNWAIPPAAYDTVVLHDLDPPDSAGYYHLDGPYVNTSLTPNRATEPSPVFDYQRQDDRFEEVMAYYHIDREQRYFQNELQTPNANNESQDIRVDYPLEDNSMYISGLDAIYYGSGGVDDAEDADVILHEYGHAVQDDINPYQGGGQTGAMGEGYGDYLAGSYSLSVDSTFHPNWVFTWDGHNEFWAGRILNAPYHYPENAWGEEHDSGQLWSAGLMDVWWDIPDRIAWDRIVLQHHFLLGYAPLMEDAADAILTTELVLYNGAYRQIILQNFGERGFINPANYYPVITTVPLPDTEDTLQAQFEVTAQITSQIPLDLENLLLFWRCDQGSYFPVPLTANGNPNEYHAVIPGPFNNQTISYYLTAADTTGMAGFAPPGAPAECYQFHVGADHVPPQVVWTDSLGQTIFLHDSLTVRAVVTDNISVDSVQLIWQVDTGNPLSVPMTSVGGDTFQGVLVYSCQTLGQTVYYHVRAVDGTSQANVGEGPDKSFTVSASAQLDDFEGVLGPWIFTGNWGLGVQFVHSGSHSLEDTPGTPYQSNSNTWAQWGDSWDFSSLSSARLTFWEWHILQADHDFGRVEASADDGPWQTLLEVTGLDTMYRQREVSLDAFCAGNSHDLRIRFRVVTDDSINLLGWYLDDLSLAASLQVPVVPQPSAPSAPLEFALHPVKPNPFNPATTISYQLPAYSRVRLTVWDTAGRLVTTLVDQMQTAGDHMVTLDGSKLASGLYFVRMQTGNFSAVRKALLIK